MHVKMYILFLKGNIGHAGPRGIPGKPGLPVNIYFYHFLFVKLRAPFLLMSHLLQIH